MTTRAANRFRILCYAALLAALNFYFCRELFRTAYLDNFQSNEGILVQLAHFITQHFGAKWYPYWNIGLPAENTYEPLMPALIALLSAVTPVSPPLALHILCGLFLCLVPVAWFWLMWRWGLDSTCAFVAGLIYSLISPSNFPIHALPEIFEWRRIRDVVFWGDIAHLIATGFLPVALLMIERAIRVRRPIYYLAAVVFSALTSLSDQFGITALSLCTLAVVASLDFKEMRPGLGRAMFIGVLTYLSACRVLTPGALAIVSKNAQLLGEDYRFSKFSILGWAIVIAGAAVIRYAARRAGFPIRFASIMAWTFWSIYAMWLTWHIPILPVTERYCLEVDLGVCLLLAILLWQIPVRVRWAVLAVLLALAVPQVRKIRHNARLLMKPIDATQTVEYRSSEWIARNLPGVRIMDGGAATYWFDYWTDNPQLSGGHDGLAPNIMQRIATFTIFVGENAGARDAEYSIFWMKAFGVGAIYVAGANSPDHIHPFIHPEKFEGRLRELWKEGDAHIYSSGVRTNSLAHIIPPGAVVASRPIHGLDTAPAEAYVRALDDVSLPEATVQWQSTDRGTIDATLTPGQLVSLQVTYDPGWIASSNGRQLTIRSDGLGMMVIEPQSAGPTKIDIEFTGGVERAWLFALSVITIMGLCFWTATSFVRR